VGTGFVQRSFAGGEVAPTLAVRVDQPRARFGLMTCRNMVVMRNGALTNRNGLRYLHPTKGNAAARLLPFIFDEDDSYWLEVGNGYIRFIRSGARVTVSDPPVHSSTAFYEPGDIVRVDTDPGAGTTWAHYYCIAPHVGNTPPNASFWYELTMTATGGTGGTSILEVPSPFTAALGLWGIHDPVQSGDVLTLSHPDVGVYELTRWGATDWTLLRMPFGPPLRAPVKVAATKAGTAGKQTYRYKVTAVKRETYEESLVGCTARQESGEASLGAPADIRVTTAAAHGLTTSEIVYVSEVNCLSGTPDEGFIAQLKGKLYALSAITATTFDLDTTDGITIPSGTYEIVVTACDAPAVLGSFATGTATGPANVNAIGHGLATGDEVFVIGLAKITFSGPPPTVTQSEDRAFVGELTGKVYRVTRVDANNFTLDGTEGLVTTAGAHDGYYCPTYTEITLAVAPSPPVAGDGIKQQQHAIRCAPVKDAIEYWVYKEKNGVYGYIATMQPDATTGAYEALDEGQEPDMSKVPPEYRHPFLRDDRQPQAAGYVQQRLCLGGAADKPQTVLASRTGDFRNFTTRSPLEDDDALEFAVAGQRAYRIRHLVDMDGQLVILTAGSELVARGDSDGVVRPTAINLATVSNVGASAVTPVLVGGSLLFEQARGGRVFDLRRGGDGGGMQARDLTTWAPHLVDGYSLVDMAFASAPMSALLATRSDGRALGLTFVPEQDIEAWWRIDTANEAGTGIEEIESVAVAPEGAEDIACVVVKRTVNGATVRYIERLAERHEGLFTSGANDARAVFLDSHVAYTASADGAATVAVAHLVGRTVYGLRDGVEIGPLTVDGSGNVTVTANWSTLVLGIRLIADVELLPVDFDGARDAVADRRKGIPRVSLIVRQSRGMMVGPSLAAADLKVVQLPKTVTGATALVDGVMTATILGGWDEDMKVAIRHTSPLPFTLMGVVLDTAFGGRS